MYPITSMMYCLWIQIIDVPTCEWECMWVDIDLIGPQRWPTTLTTCCSNGQWGTCVCMWKNNRGVDSFFLFEHIHVLIVLQSLLWERKLWTVCLCVVNLLPSLHCESRSCIWKCIYRPLMLQITGNIIFLFCCIMLLYYCPALHITYIYIVYKVENLHSISQLLDCLHHCMCNM